MSDENAELVRRLYRAMDSRDSAAVASFIDPNAEWIPDRRVGDGPVRGRDDILRFFGDRVEMFGRLTTEVERLWESGDKVLAFVRLRGVGDTSGAGFDIRIAHVWTIHSGVIVRGEGYGDRGEALEAVGVSE